MNTNNIAILMGSLIFRYLNNKYITRNTPIIPNSEYKRVNNEYASVLFNP
jgi:CTP:phosphocholine cytidylyltransferase-like protein